MLAFFVCFFFILFFFIHQSLHDSLSTYNVQTHEIHPKELCCAKPLNSRWPYAAAAAEFGFGFHTQEPKSNTQMVQSPNSHTSSTTPAAFSDGIYVAACSAARNCP
jgi:hypothetical protein